MGTRRMCETVLLVNEDRDRVDVTGDALRACGILVLLAPDAGQALAVMRSGLKPDAILIDATASTDAARIAEFVGAISVEPSWSETPVLCVAGESDMLQLSPRHRSRRMPVPASAAELDAVLEALCAESRGAERGSDTGTL